jgi:hypothetical protein
VVAGYATVRKTMITMQKISKWAGLNYTPSAVCPECGEECEVKPLDNSFDYAGTHCTGGVGGTHYPMNYGSPVSDCCEAPMED